MGFFFREIKKNACGALRVKLRADKMMQHPACYAIVKVQSVVNSFFEMSTPYL